MKTSSPGHRTFALFLLLGALPVLAGDGYEEPPVLEAENLLPAELLKGDRHVVEPEVPTDGFMTYFTIHSDFGTYRAASSEEARQRIHEIRAIAALVDTRHTDIVADAVVEGVRKPFLATMNVITQPKETVQNLGEGLGRWVERGKLKLRKAKNRTEEAYDEAKAALEKETPESPDTAARSNLVEEEVRARAIEAGEDPEQAVASYRQRREQNGLHGQLAARTDRARQHEQMEWVSEKVDGAARKYIGYDSARRDLARGLKIDPHSDNLRLQEELDRLAWTQWASKKGFGLVLPTPSLVDTAEQVNDVVWATNPKDLEVRNRKAMKAMGVDGDSRDAFFDNRLYTASHRTRMVMELGALEGVSARDHVFRLAAVAPDWQLAAYFRKATVLLSGYHTASGLDRLLPDTEILLAAVSRDGDLILPLPVDHLAWTEPVDLLLGAVERSRREAGFEGGVVLLLGGDLTDRSRREIEGLGWKIRSDFLDRP